MKPLRPYQRESIDSLYQYWRQGGVDPALIVIPTGGGKSLVMAQLIREIVEGYGARVLLLSHVKELLEQDYDEILELWPEAPIGIFSASLKRKEIQAPILVAGIQSIEKHVHKLDPAPEIVLIDECFTGDTKISTPFGNKRIDNMRCGDVVYNASGIGIVEAISIKKSDEIYIIGVSNGEIIRCTGSHPVFTGWGWTKARDLVIGQNLFSVKDMQVLRKNFLSMGHCRGRKNKESFSRKALGKTRMLRSVLRKKVKKSNGKRGYKTKDDRIFEKNWTQTIYKRWERMFEYPTNITLINTKQRLGIGSCNSNEATKIRSYIPNVLQGGYRKQRTKSSYRIRWSKPLWKKDRKGQEERCIIENIRVESISVEKRSGNVPVYNLQVSGHPSYYANGILVHNCHLMSTTDGSRYKRAMVTLKAMYPKLRVVGLSATPYRMDRGWLHKGEGAFFGSIVYDAKIQSLIDDGYLAQLVVKAGKATISTDGLHKQGKEWKAGELEARAMEGDVTRIAVEDMITRGADRKKWLIFAAGKLHAKQILDELEAHGIPAGMVLGDTAHGEREALVSGHKYGDIRALVTINVLSTGYNNPSIDLLALMRPTESASLYVQQVGRGSRLAPGKADCLVLDYAGVVVRHGPIDAVDPERKPSTGDGVPPAKVCPECESIIAAGFRHCPICGHEFPPPALKIAKKPTEAPILKSQIVPERHEVELTTWAVHKKPGSHDSVRVTYHLPGDMGYTFNEWIFPESEGQRGQYFYWQWCKDAGIEGGSIASEVVKGDCPQVSAVWTMKDGKYQKVVKREWK
jgi:superfamily II DNA or RNA helicase